MKDEYNVHREFAPHNRLCSDEWRLHARNDEDMKRLASVMERFVKAYEVQTKAPVNVYFERTEREPLSVHLDENTPAIEVDHIQISGKNIGEIVQRCDPNETNLISRIQQKDAIEKDVFSTEPLIINHLIPGVSIALNFGGTRILIDYESTSIENFARTWRIRN